MSRSEFPLNTGANAKAPLLPNLLPARSPTGQQRKWPVFAVGLRLLLLAWPSVGRGKFWGGSEADRSWCWCSHPNGKVTGRGSEVLTAEVQIEAGIRPDESNQPGPRAGQGADFENVPNKPLGASLLRCFGFVYWLGEA